MLSTQPYKGTRDFYPQQMRVRQWIFNRIRQTLHTFGYEEYDGPMLEPFELYASKTSEEIVNQQLYWLVDRGERKLAVRPEMTPTLARMVAAKQTELPKPIRWYSIPNLWRYERPQRGRLREHWQLNVDTFGGEKAAEDLELCQVICALMAGFGAKDGFEVRINHRGLTDYLFKEKLKLTETQIPVVGGLLDAALKMGDEKFRASLAAAGLEVDQVEFLVDLLNPAKTEKITSLLAGNADFQHLQTLFSQLSALGLARYFRFDPSIMRGFLYYTGMVLEVYDLHPENNRALFGGGRYDNLVGMFGGQPLSGVGFGMGDVTFLNFLEVHRLLPADLQKRGGFYIAHLDSAQFLEAQKLAFVLRELIAKSTESNQSTWGRFIDIPVITALEAAKPRKIFETAEKLGANCVVFVGEKEVAAQKFEFKDLVHKVQLQGGATDFLNHYLQSFLK